MSLHPYESNIADLANSRAFEVRVNDAKSRLLAGESAHDIREQHGLIVLQAARQALEPSWKRGEVSRKGVDPK